MLDIATILLLIYLPFLAICVAHFFLRNMVVPQDFFSYFAGIIGSLGAGAITALILLNRPAYFSLLYAEPGGMTPWLRPYTDLLGIGAVFSFACFPYFAPSVSGKKKSPEVIRRYGIAIFVLVLTAMVTAAYLFLRYVRARDV
jgi:hypothetical protein